MNRPDEVTRYLNNLSADEGRAELLRCCHSTNWADQMMANRPFADGTELLALADSIWNGLDEDDWREAFAAHPMIGDQQVHRNAAPGTGRWAQAEQEGVAGSSAEVLNALAAGNQLYRERYGFVFLICATGLSAAEMLGQMQTRLLHTHHHEIRVASEEQRQITRLRLEKLGTP